MCLAFFLNFVHVNPSGHLLEVIHPLKVVVLILTAVKCTYVIFGTSKYISSWLTNKGNAQFMLVICFLGITTKLALNAEMIEKEMINVLLVRNHIGLFVWAL